MDMMPAPSIVDVDAMDKIHVKKEELEEDQGVKLRGLAQEEILLPAINTGPCRDPLLIQNVDQDMIGAGSAQNAKFSHDDMVAFHGEEEKYQTFIVAPNMLASGEASYVLVRQQSVGIQEVEDSEDSKADLVTLPVKVEHLRSGQSDGEMEDKVQSSIRPSCTYLQCKIEFTYASHCFSINVTNRTLDAQ